jgi:hypothetical protein
MISDILISLLHTCLILFIGSSPFVSDDFVKIISFILLIFIVLHFITKYGKCGFVNIERYFLGKDFRKGFLFRLVKPIISYKNNFFYENLFWLMLIYIFILYYQINEKRNIYKIFYN